jgi:hypothetical protein
LKLHILLKAPQRAKKYTRMFGSTEGEGRRGEGEGRDFYGGETR